MVRLHDRSTRSSVREPAVKRRLRLACLRVPRVDVEASDDAFQPKLDDAPIVPLGPLSP